MKHLPDIFYKTILHNCQRYCTVGDYYNKKSGVQFRVSATKPEYELLVLIHELVCNLFDNQLRTDDNGEVNGDERSELDSGALGKVLHVNSLR